MRSGHKGCDSMRKKANKMAKAMGGHVKMAMGGSVKKMKSGGCVNKTSYTASSLMKMGGLKDRAHNGGM